MFNYDSIKAFFNLFDYNYGLVERYATAKVDLDLYFKHTEKGYHLSKEYLHTRATKDWHHTNNIGNTEFAGYKTLNKFLQYLTKNGWSKGAKDIAGALLSKRTIADSTEIMMNFQQDLLSADKFAKPTDFIAKVNSHIGEIEINDSYNVVEIKNQNDIKVRNFFTVKRIFTIDKNREQDFDHGYIEIKVVLQYKQNPYLQNYPIEKYYDDFFNNDPKFHENLSYAYKYVQYNSVKHYLHKTLPSAIYTIENIEFLKKTYNEIASYLNAENWKVEKEINTSYLAALHLILSSLDSYATGNLLPIINSVLYNSKTSYEGDFIIDTLTTVASMAMNFYTGGAMSLLSVLALEGVKYGLTQYGYEKDSGIIQGLEFASSTEKFLNASNIAAKVIEGTKTLSVIVHNAGSIKDNAINIVYDIYDYLTNFIYKDSSEEIIQDL